MRMNHKLLHAIAAVAAICVLISAAAHAACPYLIHFETDRGTYQPGGVVHINVILQCTGPASCGPCTLFFHIGSGCGEQIGWVDVESLPPGISTDLSIFMILPQSAPNGTYHICLRPQCGGGCDWTCDGCANCECAEQWITINSAIVGDVTGDGAINVQDLLAVIESWGQCKPPPANCPADVAPAPGGDGEVGVADLLAIIRNWT